MIDILLNPALHPVLYRELHSETVLGQEKMNLTIWEGKKLAGQNMDSSTVQVFPLKMKGLECNS